jgi:hypothetical protein
MKDLPTFDPPYFFHDWLAEHYAPIDLKRLIPLVRANGLRFAGSVNCYDLILDDLVDDARRMVEALDDAGERLALLDVLHGGHIFHRDLLIRSDAPPEAAPDGITELSFAFRGTREEIATEHGPAVRYSLSEKTNVTTNTPATIAVIDCLRDADCAEVPYGELQRRTGLADELLRAVLLHVIPIGVVSAHATPQPFVINPGERPRAGLLARIMPTLGNWAITLRGTRADMLDRETELCLALCDGTRTREQIAAAMTTELEAPVPVEMVDAAIRQLARNRAFEA